MYAKYKIKILTIDSFITRFVNSNIYPRKYQKAGLQLRFFLKKLKITRSVLALSGIKIGEIFPKFSLPLYRIRDSFGKAIMARNMTIRWSACDRDVTIT